MDSGDGIVSEMRYSALIPNVELASGSVSGWFDIHGTGMVDLWRDGRRVVCGYDESEILIMPLGEGTSLLIDTQGLFCSSFGVTRNDGLSAAESFLLSVSKLITKFSPRTITFCGEGTRKRCLRKELYDKYKSNRPPKSLQFKAEFSSLHIMLEAMGFPVLCSEGFEADDVMATVAMRHLKTHAEVIVASRDKDMKQLIPSGATVVSPVKTNDELNLSGLGIELWQFVDYMSLVGDVVDGIPGVSGIGEKKAAELLRQHRCLEGIIASGDTSTNAVKVRENQEMARICRQLFSLRVNVPVDEASQERIPHAASVYGVKNWVIRKLENAL